MKWLALFVFLFAGWAIAFGLATLLWQLFALPNILYFLICFPLGMVGGYLGHSIWRDRWEMR